MIKKNKTNSILTILVIYYRLFFLLLNLERMTFPAVIKQLKERYNRRACRFRDSVIPLVLSLWRYDPCIHVARYLSSIRVEVARLNNMCFIMTVERIAMQATLRSLWLWMSHTEPPVDESQQNTRNNLTVAASCYEYFMLKLSLSTLQLYS